MNPTFISYEDFKKTDLYPQFIKENPSTGTLKVQVFTAYKAIPIADAEISISKNIGNYKVIFFRGVTNYSGIIDNISLPAPVNATEYTMVAPSYTSYDLTAIHVGYETIEKFLVAMLGNIKVIQYVRMTPKVTLKGVVQNGN